MILYLLRQRNGTLICTDEIYSYYTVCIDGRYLMYRKRTLRPDSRKAYYLTDEFAKFLGFDGLYFMSVEITSLQYWRRFVSVERLTIALNRFKYGFDLYK